MVDLGFTKIHNDVIIGHSPSRYDLNVETAANMIPGRLATKGTTDFDIVVGSAILSPAGYLGYGQGPNSSAKPATRDTAFAADVLAPLHRGGGFPVRSSLALGAIVERNDHVANWANGEVIGPVSPGDGGLWLKIPFVKKTSEYDTGIEIPAGMLVADTLIEVVTNVASGTIDVGLLSTEGGGDADGFIDGQDLATAGMYNPAEVITAGSSETYISSAIRGALLATVLAGTDAATDVGTYKPLKHLADGTAKTISYTTSDHAVTGNIYLLLVHPNFQRVGQAMESVDATAAAAALWEKSLI